MMKFRDKFLKSKKATIGSWSLKRLKQKTKSNQAANIKNDRKIKNNLKYNTHNGPISQDWIDGRYPSSIWYAIFIWVRNNLLIGFGVILESISINPE